MELEKLYDEFDGNTGYFFKKHSYGSVFGFNVVSLDRILRKHRKWDNNKSLRDNITVIFNQRTSDLVEMILDTEKINTL